MKTTDKQSGFVLPITLVILSLLTVLSMGLSQMARQDVAKVRQRQQILNDEIQLKSAHQWALYHLLTGKPEYNIKHNASIILPVDNRPVMYHHIEIRVQDVAGLMGLYYYQPQRFEQLLNQLTNKQHATQIAAQLKDWIDKDTLTSYQGMEAADYLKAQQPMLPRNAPIRSLDELLELPAMTPALFNGNYKQPGLRDLLLAGGVTEFNITTAPDILLGPMLGIKGKKLAQVQTLKKANDWQHLQQIIDKIGRFFESPPFYQAFQYRIILTAPDGHKARSLIQLTPHKAKPYQQKMWQYPDDERG